MPNNPEENPRLQPPSPGAQSRRRASGRPNLRPKSESLLTTSEGQPLTRNTVRLILDRLSEKVEFRLSTHTFRHTFTTMMLRRGCDLETLRQMGGWCLAGNIYPVLVCSYWVCGCSLPSPAREQPQRDPGLGHPARPGANIGGMPSGDGRRVL